MIALPQFLVRVRDKRKQFARRLRDGFRTLGRFIEAAKGLALRDSWKDLGSPDLLLVSADLDKSELTVDGLRFDRLLDATKFLLSKDKISCESLARPLTLLNAAATWGAARSCNRAWTIGLSLDILFSVGYSRYFRTRFFSRVLERTSPRIIITIGGRPELFRAARTLGITSVELLHAHGYANFDNFFESIATIDQPDLIWALDQLSSDALRGEGWFRGETQVVGDPWKALSARMDVDGFSDLFFKFERLEALASRRVLVTLQWPYSGNRPAYSGQLADGVLPNSLTSLFEYFSEDVLWLIRLHPVQRFSSRRVYRVARARVSEVADRYPNVLVDTPSSAPLQSLFPIVTHHITMSSSTLLLSAERGIPTLALDKQNVIRDLQVGSLTSSGLLHFCDDEPQQVKNWLISQTRNLPSCASGNCSPEETVIVEAVTNLLQKSPNTGRYNPAPRSIALADSAVGDTLSRTPENGSIGNQKESAGSD